MAHDNCRKLKRGNSLLCQSVNSPYCSRWRMRWRIMAWTFPCFLYSYRNTAFSQSKLTFSKCYFIIYTQIILACSVLEVINQTRSTVVIGLLWIFKISIVSLKQCLHYFKTILTGPLILRASVSCNRGPRPSVSNLGFNAGKAFSML